jgi:LysR family transcriptional regulator of gallate degradation
MDPIPNIRHLRVFREIVRQGSITAAASRVHLSQPAVTQALAKLEDQLGVALVERQRGGMSTTAIGAIYLKRVETALQQLRSGARDAIRLGNRQGARGFADFDRLMTVAQLRVLVAMIDARNFSIAARHVGLSQPTLHRSARNLEKLSGLDLFSSNSEGISLTPAAMALVQRVKLALVELRQGADEIGEYLGQDSTHLVVGSLPLARSSILPDAIHNLIEAAEKAQVRVVDGRYEELLYGLRHGDIDFLIGALRDPPPVDDIVQEPLFDDPLSIVARRAHPLAGKNNVSLEETLEYPWVAPPRAAPAGSYLYETLKIGNRKQTPVRIVSSSLILVRGLLMRGNYMTIISLHQIGKELADGLLVPIKVDLKNNSRPIGLTFREGWRATRTQSVFLELVRSAARTAHQDGDSA